MKLGMSKEEIAELNRQETERDLKALNLAVIQSRQTCGSTMNKIIQQSSGPIHAMAKLGEKLLLTHPPIKEKVLTQTHKKYLN